MNARSCYALIAAIVLVISLCIDTRGITQAARAVNNVDSVVVGSPVGTP